MARLVDESGREFIPGSSCLVGRSATSQLVVSSAWVSGQHATLRWNGRSWEVRDLGSKNGTYVHGRRIEPGEWIALTAGDRIGFGRTDEGWLLEEDEPPQALAWLGDKMITAVDDLLMLPGPDDPELCVYRNEAGIWVAEAGDEIVPVRDGERVHTHGRAYRLELPQVLAETRDMRASTLAQSQFVFHVSRDLEHIDLDVVVGSREVRLPHRAHHELLLTLAEARIEDATADATPDSEHGWRYQDDIARMLRIPPGHFNMTIYRARQQFRKHGFDDSDAVFERRRGSGQLRIGIGRIVVRQA